MVRKTQRQQSLNSSIVTVTNNSILEDGELEYSEFIKRFDRPDLDGENDVKLIGYEKTIGILRRKIKTLLIPESNKQASALITGPSGTGKTTVVRKLAQQYSTKLTFLYLQASWMLEKQFGNPESRIRLLFNEAIQKAPSLIFIDNIEIVCPKKRTDKEDRVFYILMDKLESIKSLSAKVLVLAATDQPEVLDLRIKARYFSNEIEFTLPNRQDRAAFLKHLTDKHKHDLSEEQIEQIADASHCYLYNDLGNLCNTALEHDEDHNESLLTYSSLKLAQSQIKPAIIKSITTPCRPLRWEDIGGVDSVKKILQKKVILPIKHREEFQKYGIRPSKGAILYGPPGCSKTMLAQALATESGYNFIAVKGPELFTKWVGDSEAAVRKLYRNACEIAPCIIFFDEIDSFAPERSDNNSSSVGDKVVAQLLIALDGIEQLDDVFTIAATNRPDKVDSALLRSGRLCPAIYIPLPSEEDRKEIFKLHMRSLSLESEDLRGSFVDKLASLTSGYSGADIAEVCSEAASLALLESLDNKSNHTEWKHFEEALENITPTTIAEQLKTFEKFQERSLRVRNVKTMKTEKRFNLNRLMRSLRLKKRKAK